MRLPAQATTGAAAARRGLWFFYVFAGGFFLHTLATILIFLCVPTARAIRISPVFRAWPVRLRLIAWLQFLAGVGLHAAVFALLGPAAWLALLGLPMLVFAWFWSMLLYIYHYRAPVGPAVRDNVRSLPRQPFFSWLLLNFNEHAAHHRNPNIPWYALSGRSGTDLEQRDGAGTLFSAVWQQRRGPILWTPE
jgi:fatty acid desaturase